MSEPATWTGSARDALCVASAVHQAVDYRPIIRYDVAGGYTNLVGLASTMDIINREQQP